MAAPQFYLVTPSAADSTTLGPVLMRLLSAAPIAALLVQRGAADDAAYRELASTCINIGQGANCAVLLENDWALAQRLGADGVHVSAGLPVLEAAIDALKPALIVGAGPLGTRHDAMTLGELDLDYLWFGPLDTPADAAALDLAQWWAETFEVPGVVSGASAARDVPAVEFVALGSEVWSAPDPVAALAALLAPPTDRPA